jgi:hypothetical protein
LPPPPSSATEPSPADPPAQEHKQEVVMPRRHLANTLIDWIADFDPLLGPTQP